MSINDPFDRAQLLSRRGALSLEIQGLKRRGRSAYVICKEVYGLKGSRQKVLDQLNEMIVEMKKEAGASE